MAKSVFLSRGRTAAVDEALAAHGIPTCLFPMEEVGGF